MPFEDILSDIAEVGASGRRGLLRPVAIAGLLAGAALGGYLGYHGGGVAAMFGGVAAGAVIGWLLALVLRGLALLAVLFIAVLLLTFGWQWLTGGVG